MIPVVLYFDHHGFARPPKIALRGSGSVFQVFSGCRRGGKREKRDSIYNSLRSVISVCLTVSGWFRWPDKSRNGSISVRIQPIEIKMTQIALDDGSRLCWQLPKGERATPKRNGLNGRVSTLPRFVYLKYNKQNRNSPRTNEMCANQFGTPSQIVTASPRRKLPHLGR